MERVIRKAISRLLLFHFSDKRKIIKIISPFVCMYKFSSHSQVIVKAARSGLGRRIFSITTISTRPPPKAPKMRYSLKH